MSSATQQKRRSLILDPNGGLRIDILNLLQSAQSDFHIKDDLDLGPSGLLDLWLSSPNKNRQCLSISVQKQNKGHDAPSESLLDQHECYSFSMVVVTMKEGSQANVAVGQEPLVSQTDYGEGIMTKPYVLACKPR